MSRESAKIDLALANAMANAKNEWDNDPSHVNSFSALMGSKKSELIVDQLRLIGFDIKETMPKITSSTLMINLSHDVTTASGKEIVMKLIPEFMDKFLPKNAAYGDAPDDLGPKGIFPDINRKTRRLRKDVWDGEPVEGVESTTEVIQDLIGHLFILWYTLQKIQWRTESLKVKTDQQKLEELG